MKMKPYLFSNSLMALCGSLLVALGFLAILGWHLGQPTWAELNSGLVGMVYNSALLFILAGLALVLRVFHKQAPCLWVGRVVAILALVALFEHLFQIKTGIDQMLFRHSLRLESTHPGRMATNSAIALLFFGVGLIMAGSRKNISGKNLLLGLCATMTLAFGLDALLGHYAQVQIAFRWGSVPMALNSALAFTIAGISLLAFLGRHAREEGIFSPRWISAVAGSFVFLYAIGQWQTLVSREDLAVARSSSLFGSHFARFLEIRLQQEFAHTKRITLDLEARGEVNLETWNNEIKPHFLDRPFALGVELKDGSWSRVISTGIGNKAYVTMGKAEDFVHYGKTRVRFFRKDKTHASVFEFAVPLVRPGQPTRYLVTGYDANLFIANALNTWSSPRYSITVTSGTEEIFTNDDQVRSSQRSEAQISSVNLDGVRWFVRARPTPAEYLAFRSFLPEVVFTFEALFALFVFLGLRSLETKSRLSTLMQSLEDGVVGIDLDGSIGAWNAASERIFGYTNREILGKSFLTLFLAAAQNEAGATLVRAKADQPNKARLIGVNKTGAELNLSISVCPVKDSFGQVIGISTIVRDIWTEAQKESFRAQKSAENKEVELQKVA